MFNCLRVTYICPCAFFSRIVAENPRGTTMVLRHLLKGLSWETLCWKGKDGDEERQPLFSEGSDEQRDPAACMTR